MGVDDGCWKKQVARVLGGGKHPGIRVAKCPAGHPAGGAGYGVHATQKMSPAELINEHTGHVEIVSNVRIESTNGTEVGSEPRLITKGRAKLKEKWALKLDFGGYPQFEHLVLNGKCYRNEMASASQP